MPTPCAPSTPEGITADLPGSVAPRRPLDVLSWWLRQGSSLACAPAQAGGKDFVLSGSRGEVARAPRLDELAILLCLAAGGPPRGGRLVVRLRPALLLRLNAVRLRDESLSAFVRHAVQAEIARREAEDAAFLKEAKGHA